MGAAGSAVGSASELSKLKEAHLGVHDRAIVRALDTCWLTHRRAVCRRLSLGAASRSFTTS